LALSLAGSLDDSGWYTGPVEVTVDSTLTGLTYSIDGGAPNAVPSGNSFEVTGDGVRTVVVGAANSNLTATRTVRIDAGGLSPVISIVAPTEPVPAGSMFALTFACADPSVTSCTGLLTLPDETEVPYASGSVLRAVAGDYSLMVTADDAVTTTGPSTRTETVTVVPVAPTIDAITGPTVPAVLGTALDVSIEFSDPELTDDDYTVTFDWGLDLFGQAVVDNCLANSDGGGAGSDGASTCSLVEPTITESGTATGTIVYPEPGVYTVTVTVEDASVGVAVATHEFIVIFDPGGGRVAGSGIYWSDSDSFMGNGPPWGTIGIFGYNARYRNDAPTPTGKTSLNLLGGFRFKSTAYDYLIVNDTVAVTEGVGRLNGEDGYRMRVQGVDNGRYDFFQITIWVDATGEIIYDNGILYEEVPDNVLDDLGDEVRVGGIRIKE